VTPQLWDSEFKPFVGEAMTTNRQQDASDHRAGGAGACGRVTGSSMGFTVAYARASEAG
jgi:hypothetical protein